MGGKDTANPILVTGAAGRVGAVGRMVTELDRPEFCREQTGEKNYRNADLL